MNSQKFAVLFSNEEGFVASSIPAGDWKFQPLPGGYGFALSDDETIFVAICSGESWVRSDVMVTFASAHDKACLLGRASLPTEENGSRICGWIEDRINQKLAIQ